MVGTVYEIVLSLLSHFLLVYVLPKKIKLTSNCETCLIERGLDATIAFLGSFLTLAFWEKRVDVAINRSEGIIGCFMLRCCQKLSSLSKLKMRKVTATAFPHLWNTG